MPPIQDDTGPSDLHDPVAGEFHYIIKVSTELDEKEITYFLPVGRPFGFSSPYFNCEKNLSIGLASYELGPVYITGIPRSHRYFSISSALWYLAPSRRSTVSLLQSGRSASNLLTSIERYILMTSVSVLTWVKEAYISPSLSIAAMTVIRGCTNLFLHELVVP